MPISLKAEHDVVGGNGVFTEMHKLQALANEDIPMLQTISTQAYPFSDTDAVKHALDNVSNFIGSSGIKGCSLSECGDLLQQALTYSFNFFVESAGHIGWHSGGLR